MDDTITMQVSLPLDPQGFLRQECPYCRRQFKINPDFDDGVTRIERTCPYCEQSADPNQWMTREQNTYIEEIAMGKAVEIFDVALLDSLRGAPNVRVEVPARRRSQPSLRPEADDMDMIPLPCCSTEMKIDPGWTKEIYCYICGYRIR